jgi:hypothetical protein
MFLNFKSFIALSVLTKQIDTDTSKKGNICACANGLLRLRTQFQKIMRMRSAARLPRAERK